MMASYLEQLDCLTRDISDSFPGNDALISQLVTLITTCPPTFTYLHDPHTPRATASLVNTLTSSLSAIDAKSFAPDDDAVPIIASAQINAIASFSPRLFYDTTFNRLAKWRPRWEDGCENWPGGTAGGGVRYNDSLDGFLHGLRALQVQLCGDETEVKSPRKGRGKTRAQDAPKVVKMVLVVDRAERLKESLPGLLVPLTRLAELVSRLQLACLLLIKPVQSRVDIQTIFISQSPWEDIKPPLGAAIDPFHISVCPLSQEGKHALFRS
jgi:origin recognition complex subunit 5